jgi:hypothetical protein
MRPALLLVLVAILGGCPEKKKPPPPPAAGEGSTAPILQPVENKLDKAMDKNEDRAKPDPE